MTGSNGNNTDRERRRITQVTTAGGDGGETSLADGSRLAKVSPRIEAIGAVDELNSFLGQLILELERSPELAEAEIEFLYQLQQSLFDLGGALAFPEGMTFPDPGELTERVQSLNRALPPLKEFVLPGGRAASVAAHLCRTVCRRAERRLWAMSPDADDGARYLNRLSDYFFVLARTVNQGFERQWRGRTPS
ncbi:MAG: cob(I)yrinic acid a,c-diamide adenosyltransferase [Pseudomonadota bacterium]